MTHVGHELSKLTVRRFLLRRDKDVSGISGLGHVAEGCTFTDGTTILRWHSGQSTAIYTSPEAVEKIHGHGNGTVIEWIDEGLDPIERELASVGIPVLTYPEPVLPRPRLERRRRPWFEVLWPW